MLNGTLGFLGFGNMGGAIAAGLIEAGRVSGKHVIVYDVDEDKQQQAKAMGIAVAESPQDLAGACSTLVLAVKPQTMDLALKQLAPNFSPKTLVISIAAGVSIRFIQERLGETARVVRVMPNTPALVNAGAAAIAVSSTCAKEDAQTARAIFESVGIAEMTPESAIDAVTALSGSGPAYFFYMVECLTASAVAEGLPEDQAARLAAQTLLGAGRLLVESHEPAEDLRRKVTSKGGTTEAAINMFRDEGFEKVIRAGFQAAVARSRELGA
jgi:pyrroline-5-carboxylate reductase